MVSSKRATRVTVLLLALALAYWTWFGLTQRTISDDEGISILAAQGILEYGYPRLPSGFLYHRSYLPHYLTAAAIGAFGLNDFSIMLPSLLFGLGSLWMAHVFARDVIGRPWTGVAAVALLLVLQVETFYATGPRMYMALQFFTMLATYSAWRGYVQGERGFQLVALLAIAAAILSHREAAAILVAVPLSLLIVMSVTRRKVPSVLSYQNLSGMVLVGLVAWLVLAFEPPGKRMLIAFHSGEDPRHLGLTLNPLDWVELALQLEAILPLGLSFLPVAVFLAIKSARWRRLDMHSGLTYALALFTFGGLAVLIVITTAENRFWLFILPIYAVIICTVVAALVEPIGRRSKNWLDLHLGSHVPALLLLVGGAAAGVSLHFLTQGVHGLGHTARLAYGPACMMGSEAKLWVWCVDLKSHHERVRQAVKPEDLIMASNPWVTNYYMGRVDGLLVQKKESGGGFTTFGSRKDEHLGIPLVDSMDQLVKLLEEQRRVWILADPLIWPQTGREMRLFLQHMYDTYYQDGAMVTYVNCIKPTCEVYRESPDEGIPLKGRDTGAYLSRGMFYADLGQPQRAMRDFDRAINLDPQHGQAHVLRGVARDEFGDLQGAIADFEEAIRLDSQNAEAYNGRALVRVKLGELGSALDDLAQAVRLDPQLAVAYRNRALVYTLLGNDDAVQQEVTRAVDLGLDRGHSSKGRSKGPKIYAS